MNQQKRPLSITLLCILMVIGALVTIPLMFSTLGSTQLASMPTWYRPVTILSALIGLVATYGMWTMKKWSVKLYVAMTVLAQIMLIMAGSWSIFSLVLPGFIIWILYSNYNKMT